MSLFMVGGYKSFKKSVLPQQNGSIVRFASIEDPMGIQETCAGDAKKRQATKIND